MFIVGLPTIVPFYFTWSIWTGPGVAAVNLNRDDACVQCDVILSWEGGGAVSEGRGTSIYRV